MDCVCMYSVEIESIKKLSEGYIIRALACIVCSVSELLPLTLRGVSSTLAASNMHAWSILCRVGEARVMSVSVCGYLY